MCKCTYMYVCVCVYIYNKKLQRTSAKVNQPKCKTSPAEFALADLVTTVTAAIAGLTSETFEFAIDMSKAFLNWQLSPTFASQDTASAVVLNLSRTLLIVCHGSQCKYLQLRRGLKSQLIIDK